MATPAEGMTTLTLELRKPPGCYWRNHLSADEVRKRCGL
jgi:hypothetical protein